MAFYVQFPPYGRLGLFRGSWNMREWRLGAFPWASMVTPAQIGGVA